MCRCTVYGRRECIEIRGWACSSVGSNPTLSASPANDSRESGESPRISDATRTDALRYGSDAGSWRELPGDEPRRLSRPPLTSQDLSFIEDVERAPTGSAAELDSERSLRINMNVFIFMEKR